MANHTKMSCKAKGGRVAYSGGSSNVVKEANEMKRGGKADGKIGGSKAKHRIHKARGGGVSATSSPMSSAGGGGATKHPFSSAHR